MSKSRTPGLKTSPRRPGFASEAERILALRVDDRTSGLGGYGPGGEVIYERHPSGCPSVLVDNQGSATATYMSNGSIGFVVKLQNGMEIRVLDPSFDPVEKRQINAPSNNVWLDVRSDRQRHIASLVNPLSAHVNSQPAEIRVVKLGDPGRSMWYCSTFRPAPGIAYQTAVRFALALTPDGPALTREIYVRNTGKKPLRGNLWTSFTLHGTQRFVYNKELWYDSGLPLNPCEIVVSCTVPYTDIVQIKRFSTEAVNARPAEATADYATFVGDTAADIRMPQAVLAGRMLDGGAGSRLTRFSTAAVAANRFDLSLRPGQAAMLQQSLLYVTDEPTIREYARRSSFSIPTYGQMSKSFTAAARYLVKSTPSARRITRPATVAAKAGHPPFDLELPAQRRVGYYANSLWTGVKELYEKCRAHGAKLANGIELGTRDRGQDMWPKMKDDPGQVRADLVHVMGLMYVTSDSFPTDGRKLSIVQKLHGMFPRQYPSRWDDRSQVVMCDNRPYTDSPLWLINSVNMYLRETGDLSILAEEVTSVRLTDPQNPIASGIVGHERRFKLVEVIGEIFACFARHMADSPYGMCQIMYGDWCDPVDMFGTNPVGDPESRGRGRGVGVRLSAHVFHCLVESIDTLESPRVIAYLRERGLSSDLSVWKSMASRLRRNIVRWAWEEGRGMHAGFLAYIHELKADGGVPDYASGDMGYTLGSMKKEREFDGLTRRDLTANAYGLNMLATNRDYLEPLPRVREMIDALLATTNHLFFRDKLGLLLYTTPIPNSDIARRLVGRMGIIPSGAAENGEYHHAQVMMHLFRLRMAADRSDLLDTVWKQLKPMLSAMRDESLAGPFEMPTTSYASDPHDPHFGKGMYFGLSGSTDWLIEMFQSVAGVRLSLHEDGGPALRIAPSLPAEIDGSLRFRRIIHAAMPGGGYRRIPLTLSITRERARPGQTGTTMALNGQPVDRLEIADLAGVDRVDVVIRHSDGRLKPAADQ